MPKKKITRKCGHQETVWFVDGELNYPQAIKNHEDELCDSCYRLFTPVQEVEMDYKTYKIEFGNCRTKPNSYDKKTKRIIVYVPLASL